MSEILEIMMILSFGFSWPLNVMKTYKSKSTKGKSFAFLCCIFFGYICGIAAKLLADSFKWYVLFFYVLNFILVGTDLCLYLHYYKKEKAEEMKKEG